MRTERAGGLPRYSACVRGCPAGVGGLGARRTEPDARRARVVYYSKLALQRLRPRFAGSTPIIAVAPAVPAQGKDLHASAFRPK